MGRNPAEHHLKPAFHEHCRRAPRRLRPRRLGPQGMASLPIPDELLAEIFVRLPTPIDLVHASAACVAFRRVVADSSFLRQYRKLHHPPLLGFLRTSTGFLPAKPPHPSASVASAVAFAADFSFSFVPSPASTPRWVIRDIRDGRVLLAPMGSCCGEKEMVVCDPLHRRYLLLPPIPHHLAAMLTKPRCNETFLISQGDSHDDEAAAAQETSFRVMCMVQCQAKLISFVFSSSTRLWRAVAPHSWSHLLAGMLSSIGERLFCRRQYAYGCFYWLPGWEFEMKMLVFDTQRMEFSIADPPSEAKYASGHYRTMVESGEGRPGMFFCGYDTPGCIYTLWRHNGGSSSQWQKEKIILLNTICVT
ncbi:uncharacterized protein [Aegilops tauschii subsp. strangulata]|uniref:uncharacterized protein n=1 Tax=Aegilops tauschii subsp. strangulata TaxID=200361 RepID=UPI00098AA997